MLNLLIRNTNNKPSDIKKQTKEMAVTRKQLIS